MLRGIGNTPPFQALDEHPLTRFRDALNSIYAPLRADSTLNEAQTEQLIIEQVFVEPGWGGDDLPQVNSSRCRQTGSTTWET